MRFAGNYRLTLAISYSVMADLESNLARETSRGRYSNLNLKRFPTPNAKDRWVGINKERQCLLWPKLGSQSIRSSNLESFSVKMFSCPNIEYATESLLAGVTNMRVLYRR